MLNIDIDITIFSKYCIDIVWKSKKWYRPISTPKPFYSVIHSRVATIYLSNLADDGKDLAWYANV